MALIDFKLPAVLRMPAGQAVLAVGVFTALQTADCFGKVRDDGSISDPKEPLLIAYVVVAVLFAAFALRGRLGFSLTRREAAWSGFMAAVGIVMGVLGFWHQCDCFGGEKPWLGGLITEANKASWIPDLGFGLERKELCCLCVDGCGNP